MCSTLTLKGVTKKTSLKLCQSFCLTALATYMLERWDIIYLKGEIHSSSEIQKLFCKISGSQDISKSKWGISRILDIGHLEIWCPILFNLYFSSLMFYRNGFELEACLRMSPSKWDMSQPSKMFIARKIMHKLRRYQIQRY